MSVYQSGKSASGVFTYQPISACGPERCCGSILADGDCSFTLSLGLNNIPLMFLTALCVCVCVGTWK